MNLGKVSILYPIASFVKFLYNLYLIFTMSVVMLPHVTFMYYANGNTKAIEIRSQDLFVWLKVGFGAVRRRQFWLSLTSPVKK